MANNQIALLAKMPELDTPFESQGKALQLRQLMNQGQAADMEMQQKRQSMADDTASRNIYSTITDPSERIAALYKVNPKLGIAADEISLKNRKSQGDIDHVAAQTQETHAKSVNLKMGQRRDSLNTVNTPQDAAQWIDGLYADPDLAKVFGGNAESAKARIPTDPQQFAEWKLQSQLGAEDLIKYTTPDANARLQAQTAVDNNASSNAQSNTNSLRTDDRARDLNETKVEDNRIKREAKDDTIKLTKSSQIASFDTMLGTLDRLGKHPGLSASVGISGKFPTMPGSDSANFQAELNTFQSQAFIPMVAQLKGMGALSDTEGKKLTAAVGALDPNMGEKAFRESVARITSDMSAARKRMVGGGTSASPTGKTISVNGASMQAQQAPNGKWYVKQSNGKYAEVSE